jgi:outer membrane receptor for ferric coprogen and ferric-rhodotorulic acid
VSFTAALRASVGYTSTEARFEGSSEQIQDIPESLTKVGLDYVGMTAPFEVSVSLVNTGDIYDQVASGIGRIEHGGYTVVDLSAAYYLDQERRHRLGARLENALDEEYATSLGRGRRDVGNAPYAYRNLGAPRTLHATYSYRF